MKTVSTIDSINTVDISIIDTINNVTTTSIDTFNGVSIPTTGSGSWHTNFDQTQWSASQGWWDTDHWTSNGWECLLVAEAAPSTGTKIRITFTGTSPLNMSLRNALGDTSYVADAFYVSLVELDFVITDTWGRLYMDGGSFNITLIELFY